MLATNAEPCLWARLMSRSRYETYVRHRCGSSYDHSAPSGGSLTSCVNSLRQRTSSKPAPDCVPTNARRAYIALQPGHRTHAGWAIFQTMAKCSADAWPVAGPPTRRSHQETNEAPKEQPKRKCPFPNSVKSAPAKFVKGSEARDAKAVAQLRPTRFCISD